MSEEYLSLTITGSDDVGNVAALDKLCPSRFSIEEIKKFHLIDIMRTKKIGDTRIRLSIASVPAHRRIKDDGILVLYDVTNRKSFDMAIRIIKEKQSDMQRDIIRYRRAHRSCCADFVNEFEIDNDMIFLVANKCDLPDRCITTKEGNECAQKLGIDYFEISAETDYGISELFTGIIKKSKTRHSVMRVRHVGTRSEWCPIM